MTKIKNFRVHFRSREIARWLKVHDHLQVTPALEASIEHAISDSKRWLQPAALYTTLTRSTAEKTTPLPFPEGAVAASVIAVTVGGAVESERAEALARQDAMQASLLGALEQEALQQATQFVVRLVEEQAKEEECELSPLIDTQVDPLLTSLGTLLGVQRIGIVLNAAAPQLPPYARLTWMSWTPLAKTSARRKESAARSEQAAV
jgi:uncharacterized oligopeptide transporter (OPT) family protein